MPGPLNIERLLGLLREQRREVVTRSSAVRGSQAWDASCKRLDRINERIMHPRDDVPPRPAAREAAGPPVGRSG